MGRIRNREGDLIPNLLVPINPISLLEEIQKKEATGGKEQASSKYVSKARCHPTPGNRNSGVTLSTHKPLMFNFPQEWSRIHWEFSRVFQMACI